MAQGRILLPNNRAVRAVTDAFVRASGSGLLLPRLIPVGDPELDERLGGALDRIDQSEPVPPAIDPNERLLRLASIVRGEGSAESLRLAADLARTLDALLIEQIAPVGSRKRSTETSDLAMHWEKSLQKLQLIYEQWPRMLADEDVIDLAERATGCSRDSPSVGRRAAERLHGRGRDHDGCARVAALVGAVARMPGGMVVLPGLWLREHFRTKSGRRSGRTTWPRRGQRTRNST